MASNSTLQNLRKFGRQEPGAVDSNALFEELNAETDRAVGIVGATMLESQLEALLSHHMSHLDVDTKNKLFNAYGPLSSFSAKIKIAYAFKLCSKAIYKDLDIIRDIRNTFAHARKVAEFKVPENSAACFLLSYSSERKPENYSQFDARTRYIYHISNVYIFLLKKTLKHPIKKIRKEREKSEKKLREVKKDLMNAKRRWARLKKKHPEITQAIEKKNPEIMAITKNRN